MKNLGRLLEIAGEGTYGSEHVAADTELGRWGRLGGELRELLARRNGFYAFESALHVYGSTSYPDMQLTLVDWNEHALWKSSYDGLADGHLFFGEDIFGGQFGIDSSVGQIVAFDPETAELERVADNFEDWAAKILGDADYLTGHSLARAWQQRNGPIERGSRLLPKVPFVAGGEFDVENLYSLSSVKGMRLRGEIATQIARSPDGAKISFRVEPGSTDR